ncbi:unnamed protein product, partial [Prorocentrum cordatum]
DRVDGRADGGAAGEEELEGEEADPADNHRRGPGGRKAARCHLGARLRRGAHQEDVAHQQARRGGLVPVAGAGVALLDRRGHGRPAPGRVLEPRRAGGAGGGQAVQPG